MKFSLNILVILLVAEGREIKIRTFRVDKESCVEDAYHSIFGLPSLIQCASLCLNADTCQAVTFTKVTGECKFSSIISNTTCTLGPDDGTLLLAKICPEGESYCNLEAGVYYEFVDSHQAWTAAEQGCTNRGGQLAVLDTEEKFIWMRDLRLSQSGYINTGPFWIGLRDTVGDHSWTWVNGASAPMSHIGWYTTGNEPNHAQGDTNHCAEAYAATHQTNWNDQTCTNSLRYICEYSF